MITFNAYNMNMHTHTHTHTHKTHTHTWLYCFVCLKSASLWAFRASWFFFSPNELMHLWADEQQLCKQPSCSLHTAPGTGTDIYYIYAFHCFSFTYVCRLVVSTQYQRDYLFAKICQHCLSNTVCQSLSSAFLWGLAFGMTTAQRKKKKKSSW